VPFMLSSFTVGLLLSVPIGTSDSVAAIDIQNAYTATIQLEAVAVPGGDTLISLGVKAPPKTNLLSGFLRDHERWFKYLVQNGRGFQLPGVDLPQPAGYHSTGYKVAVSRLNEDFVERLKADSQFNALVLPAIAAYLRHSGIKVSNAVGNPGRQPISIDTALTTAVRFFYPDIITKKDGILIHVCTALNGVRDVPVRNLALEALAFVAISDDVHRDSSSIEADFGPARRLMRDLDLPKASDSVRLSRAQGVMWASMARSPRLRSLLESAAKRDQVILSFQLVDP
jgi:hypothetical protein